MNTEILNQMKLLRLHGMHRAFSQSLEPDSQKYTPDELIEFLIQSESDDRYNRRINRLTSNAKFRYTASIEDIKYDDTRNIDKNMIQRLAECQFISEAKNIIVTGSTGVGKSYLASAIGYQACSLGHKVMYYNTYKLFTKLKISKADGTYLKEVNKIAKQDLLILDDFGLKTLDSNDRQYLMELIEDRHGKKSTLIASQLPVDNWHEIIAENTIADAILDRIVHHAFRLNLQGDSMRKKQRKKN